MRALWARIALVTLVTASLGGSCGDEGGESVDLGGPDAAAGDMPTTSDARADAPPRTCTDLDPTATTEPWLVVSSGFHTFECLAGGAEVPMIMGIQGGYHIWGAFRAGGFSAEPDWYFRMDFTYEQNGSIVAEAHYSDVLRSADDPQGGPYQYDSVAVIYHEELVPEDQLDVPGILRLRLSREGVVDLSGEIELTPNEITF